LMVIPQVGRTVANTAVLENLSLLSPVLAASTDVTIIVAAVPTLPEWAMIALTALLALAGVTALRRRTT
jgi:flagellar biosynthesis component FlhA